MRGLADLLSALVRLFQQWTRLFMDLRAWERSVQAQPARLREVTGFGSNPGNLRMFAYVPDQPAGSPAIVVVLHGCLQTAAGYDYGAGWSTLAERYGFALLLPEQQTANNPQRCFNWFQREDSERDQGEALSIRHMVEHMIQTFGIDRSRVFVTGLSAGGAMTSVMLATYPEVFARGRYHCWCSLPVRDRRAGSAPMHVPGPRALGPGVGRPSAGSLAAPGTLAEGLGLARGQGSDRYARECDGDHQAVDGHPRPAVKPNP
jgi:hypothetical protein